MTRRGAKIKGGESQLVIIKQSLKTGIYYFLIILTFLNLHVFPQVNKYNKKSSEFTKPYLADDYFVRCDVGNIGLTLFYDPSPDWDNINLSELPWEYPVFSGNYYVSKYGFLFMYREDSGNIKKIPSGDLYFISESANSTSILTQHEPKEERN